MILYFFTDSVLCCLRSYKAKKAEGHTIQRENLTKNYTTAIKILAYPGLANLGFENPALGAQIGTS